MADLGFVHAAYRSKCTYRAGGQPYSTPRLSCNALPPALMTRLALADLSDDLPLSDWASRHAGYESWSVFSEHRLAGQAPEREARCHDLFHESGLGAAIVIGFHGQIPRVSASLSLIGAEGQSAAALHKQWHAAQARLCTLAHIAHLQLATRQMAAPKTALTARQIEVLELTAVGCSTLEIAQKLAISRVTVEKHMRLARRTLDARSTAHAVIRGLHQDQIFNTETAADWPANNHAFAVGAADPHHVKRRPLRTGAA